VASCSGDPLGGARRGARPGDRRGLVSYPRTSLGPSALPSELLGPDGPFTGEAGYRFRPGQAEMADAVGHAFSAGEALICEAGTGTGKTLAYLLAAVRHQGRVIVSTATKALQDQIATRELPWLADRLGQPISFSIAKGVSNYVCRRRLAEARRDPSLAPWLDQVESWVRGSGTGDLAEADGIAEDHPIWAHVRSSTDTRMGQGCRHFEECFVTRMRHRLNDSQIILTNHHLFFADLALKAKAPKELGRIGVLPPYDAVVFDEAHRVEDVVSQHFGCRVSISALDAFFRTGFAVLEAESESTGLMKEAASARDALVAYLESSAPTDGRRPLEHEDELEVLSVPGAHLADKLAAFLEALGPYPSSPRLTVLARKAQRFMLDLRAVCEPATHHVVWIERKGDSLTLGVSVVDVSDIVRDLVGRVGAVVFTSATLASVALPAADAPAGEFEASTSPLPPPPSFSYFRTRMGIGPPAPAPVKELCLSSPFDFDSGAVLYVADDLPPVTAASYLSRAALRIGELLRLTDGGALVLTTSRRAMEFLAAEITTLTSRPVLLQGDAPKLALLNRMRVEAGLVLVATLGFWEGVDVPGRGLELVVIERLPFAVPSEAIVRARARALELSGVDPFRGYFVPDAAITLKQGVGRLLRSETDRGCVAVLDHRLVTKAYGPELRRTLPFASWTASLDRVRSHFADGGAHQGVDDPRK